MTAPASRKRWRAPVVYYLLVAFDVFTVSASLYLNHRIMQIYLHSVQHNQEWAARIGDYSGLGDLAAAVNAPGNDVFDSRDVASEAVRMQRARVAFHERLAALRADLRRLPAAEARALQARMGEIEGAMNEMTSEAGLIFSYLAAGRSEQAGQRMATMDRRYARVLAALRRLYATVAVIQQLLFERQTAAASTLQRFEYLIAGLILLMVAAATVYGRKIADQGAHDTRQRAAYVEGLQAAEESLRKAHGELEKRVEKRTRALRESEAALRLAAEEWRRTFEAIDSPVMILDPEAGALRLNDAATELAGRAHDEIVGRKVSALGPGEPWACAARVAERVREERAPAAMQSRDASSGRTWDVSANLVADEGGRERVIVVARDVTRLVELQESVRREERMSAMGSLVAGVAHEVRNPLFGISSTLDAFEARFGETEPFRKYVTVLRGEADRLVALMRDLLDYGKPPMLEVAEVDFEALVQEGVLLCRSLALPRDVRIVRDLRGPAGHVRLDRGRMQQVLQNVIQNAIEHSPAGGAVVVSVGQSSDRDGAHVWCSVRDSGPGFRPEDLPRLFEPFFTRRPGGTGLGLSIAQRIVSQHGGRLEASTHPEGGALMVVKLPAAGAAAGGGRMTRGTILLVEDEPAVRFGIREFLEAHGYGVEEAQSCQEAQAAFRAGHPDVAVLDYSLPDGTALDLLPRLKAFDADVPVVILTGMGSIELAVRAIKEGAEHFLTKPVELPALLVVLERLIENQRNRHRQMARRSKVARRARDPFLGNSPAMRQLAEDARRFLSSDSPVLIRGETGSGKGVLASWLHQNGPRSEEAFVDLNCATLSKELLESELFGYEKGAFTGAMAAKPGLLDVAHRGTLFLDEIGDVDPAVQPKLLNVLEDKRYRRLGDVRDRQVDVRLIAATHQDLSRLVRDNRFRSDLYYRISTIPLVVPPLRERLEDLELIAQRLLDDIASDLGRGPLSLAPEAVAALRTYAWPGNVRELRNVLERAVLLCEGRVLSRRDLRFEVVAPSEDASDAALTLDEMERRHIERMLLAENGHVESAARRLGIPRSSLYQKIKRFGLAVPRS